MFYVDHRWTTAYRLGDEAAQQAAAYLTVQAPELNFASVYGAKGNTVEIDLCYTEQDGMTPANYVDDLPLDAAFDKALLQKVPSRLCAPKEAMRCRRHTGCPLLRYSQKKSRTAEGLQKCRADIVSPFSFFS